MQSLATQGLRLNRRHPDAVGCFFAVPVMERGGETVRDLAWNGSKGLGQPVWSGTRSYVNQRRGRALSVTTGNTIATPVAGTPWTNDWSCAFTMNTSALIATKGGYLRCGGFAIAHTGSTATLEIHQDNVAVRATSGFTFSLNTEYAVSIAYRASDLAIRVYMNGVRENLTAGATITTSAFTTSVFAAFNATVATCTIRDIRIWNRFLPEAAHERYYVNPNAFYTPSLFARVRGVPSTGLAGRMFFPFLHPALQS